jgi:hypothetical protein
MGHPQFHGLDDAAMVSCPWFFAAPRRWRLKHGHTPWMKLQRPKHPESPSLNGPHKASRKSFTGKQLKTVPFNGLGSVRYPFRGRGAHRRRAPQAGGRQV